MSTMKKPKDPMVDPDPILAIEQWQTNNNKNPIPLNMKIMAQIAKGLKESANEELPF